MAYQCFLLWVVVRTLQQRLPPDELQQLARAIAQQFAVLPHHKPEVFNRISAKTAELMPIALQGGPETGVIYPIVEIIESATIAGYPLPQKIRSYRLGINALLAMRRMEDFLAPATPPGRGSQPVS